MKRFLLILSLSIHIVITGNAQQPSTPATPTPSPAYHRHPLHFSRHSLNRYFAGETAKNSIKEIINEGYSLPVRRTVLMAISLSYPDLLENAINRCRPNLVNTYDDEVPEITDDATMLFRVKLVFPFR